MSHARPEPDVPSTVNGRVPRPRPSAREDEEGGPRRVGRGPATDRHRTLGIVTGIVFGLGCLIGFGMFVNGFLGMVLVFPGETALSFVLLAVVGVVGFAVLRRIRPVRAPTMAVSILALVWGMTGALGLALTANGHLLSIWNKVAGLPFGGEWGAALTAPLNEELLKVVGIVLIAVLLPRAIRSPIDGFIVGALVGLGFQLVEDLTYSLNMIVMRGGIDGVVAVVQSFFLRVVLTGLGSHWAMTAVAGAAVGLIAAASWRPEGRRTVQAALLLLLAIVLHWLFDAPLLGSILGILFKGLLIFLTAVTVYLVARHTYRSRVRRALAEAGDELGMRRSSAMALAGRRARVKELRATPVPERPAARNRQRQMVAFAEERAVEYHPPPRPEPVLGE